jgi:CheY-like chemotaxis protein
MLESHPGDDVVLGAPTLLVCGSAASRAEMRAGLAAAGHVVHEATNGIDAIVILYVARERLTVVVDTYLPDMDGEDFLRLVAHDSWLVARHGYVLLAESSNPPSAVTTRFLAQHGIVVLAKPYVPDALAAAAERASQSLTPAGWHDTTPGARHPRLSPALPSCL